MQAVTAVNQVVSIQIAQNPSRIIGSFILRIFRLVVGYGVKLCLFDIRNLITENFIFLRFSVEGKFDYVPFQDFERYAPDYLI